MLVMTGATIFNYCERGQNASFWAEPLNALSNGAFIIAGIAALTLLVRRPQSRGAPEFGLSLLLIVIGIGSFLFHTYATAWSAMADVIPIGVFMFAYFAYALIRFAGWHPLAVLAALAVFAASLKFAGGITCDGSWLPVTAAAGRPCFNGSLAYVPALAAMLVIGLVLLFKRHPASGRVFTAGLIFAVSLAARTLDFEVCEATRILGAVRGTHVFWHLLNALTLYLLTSAAISQRARDKNYQE